MTPAKRRPATPASQGPTRTAPDVPIVANPPPVPPAETEDSTELLGPDGEPIADEAATREASRDSGNRATTQSPTQSTTQSGRRPLALYPLPVWPD